MPSTYTCHTSSTVEPLRRRSLAVDSQSCHQSKLFCLELTKEKKQKKSQCIYIIIIHTEDIIVYCNELFRDFFFHLFILMLWVENSTVNYFSDVMLSALNDFGLPRLSVWKKFVYVFALLKWPRLYTWTYYVIVFHCGIRLAEWVDWIAIKIWLQHWKKFQ